MTSFKPSNSSLSHQKSSKLHSLSFYIELQYTSQAHTNIQLSFDNVSIVLLNGTVANISVTFDDYGRDYESPTVENDFMKPCECCLDVWKNISIYGREWNASITGVFF